MVVYEDGDASCTLVGVVAVTSVASSGSSTSESVKPGSREDAEELERDAELELVLADDDGGGGASDGALSDSSRAVGS